MLMLRVSLSVLVFFLFGLPSAIAEWTSPHALELEKQAPRTLLPFPKEISWGKGVVCVPLTMPCSVRFEGHSEVDAPDYKKLKQLFPQSLMEPETSRRVAPVTVRLDKALAPSLGREGYKIDIAKHKIILQAATKAGLFYAGQTLRQLGKKTKYGQDMIFPELSMTDVPAFAYRGFMHDVGRNYQSIAELKKQLEVMSHFKLNVFHWHLSDNPAWRVESKIFPQINEAKNHKQGRDEGKMYSFEQIRDLISYAKDRHILVIPELDMPGHSAFFFTTFGCEMASPQGIEILNKLLEEFCQEIPKESCPILHIGTDEVSNADPKLDNKAFALKISQKVKDLGRIPMQWAPGLPIAEGGIAQLWGEGPDVIASKKFTTPFMDSSMGYVNAFENPYLIVQRCFFKQFCARPKGDDVGMGSILCLWPDVRVADKSKIEQHSPQWPALLAFAERSWKGSAEDGSQWSALLPPSGSEARQAFELFEKRMESFAAQLPFPYWSHAQLKWKLTDPVSSAEADTSRNALLSHPETVKMTPHDGGCISLKARSTGEGIYAQQSPGVTVWAEMKLKAPKAGDYHFFVGFDAPSRSSRRCSGIPDNGQWSNAGTRIWVNGKEVCGPTWQEPKSKEFKKDTWHDVANEIPYTDEEFWWMRKPVSFSLKSGENSILVEHPYAAHHQHWGIALLPVIKDGERWKSHNALQSIE